MTELSVARSAGLDLLDDGLRALDRRCRELADEFREPGQALDRNPDAISDYLHLTGIRLCQYSLIPAQYRPALDFPSGLMEASNSCQGMTMIFERFAYIDPGVMLASPGPSLSGGVITALADPAQSDRYYRRVASGPVTTFFGLTEPGKGSAAVELQTTITPTDGCSTARSATSATAPGRSSAWCSAAARPARSG
jgi:alkylation response protein AidB-like acyl-CoA dehydrogenase